MFGAQVWFPAERTRGEGKGRTFSRKGDSGAVIIFTFCPKCGSTVFWHRESQPDLIAVAMGAFAGEDYGDPGFSVYDNRRRSWVELTCPVERQG